MHLPVEKCFHFSHFDLSIDERPADAVSEDERDAAARLLLVVHHMPGEPLSCRPDPRLLKRNGKA